MKILNEFEREIEFPLVSIFSESLSRTTIPLDWKRAHELPVFKGGDKSNDKNCRPIRPLTLHL